MRTNLEPYAFDGPYSQCLSDPRTAMDRRHIFIVHDILKAWPFKKALEIGSYNGASATAFIEAINAGLGLGESGEAIFCDVAVTRSLVDVAANCKDRSRAMITPQPSWTVLASDLDFDFIFVDAAHDLESVTLEVSRLLKRRPLCVMAHDTNATAAGYPMAEGAEYLKKTFEALPGYYSIEDKQDRPGEETKRGLFFTTTDRGLFANATEIFRKWNIWNTDSRECTEATK